MIKKGRLTIYSWKRWSLKCHCHFALKNVLYGIFFYHPSSMCNPLETDITTWEAQRPKSSTEFSCLLWNPKAKYYVQPRRKLVLNSWKGILCCAMVQIVFRIAGLLRHLIWISYPLLHKALFSVPYEDLLSFSFQTQSSHPECPATSRHFSLCRTKTIS